MHRLRPSLTALACFALGCGGDDDRPVGTVSSGLPPDRPLSELSDAQRAVLCESFLVAVDEALADELVLLTCSFSAVGDSIGVSQSGQVRFDVAMCEQLTRECVASGSGPDAAVPSSGIGNADCASPAANEAQRSCDATVAQYERCYSGVVDDFDGLAARMGCEQARAALEAQQSMMATSLAMVPPPQCAELMQLCPRISVPATRPAGP